MKRHRSDTDEDEQPDSPAHSSPSRSHSPAPHHEGEGGTSESVAQTDVRPSSQSPHTQRESAQGTAPPPAKKKRTRTLTTPHQSAVLHALLAQSRFPTTAVREEVGRAIGLSARKVQVWFQNQRQKARRPRNQGATSAEQGQNIADIPQHGALTTAGASRSRSTPTSHPAYVGPLSYGPAPYAHPGSSPARTWYESASYPTPVSASASYLSGPGMPGPSTTSYSASFPAPPTPSRHHPPFRSTSSHGYSGFDFPPPPSDRLALDIRHLAGSESGPTSPEEILYPLRRGRSPDRSLDLPPLTVYEPQRTGKTSARLPPLQPRRWSHTDRPDPPLPYSHPVQMRSRSRSPPHTSPLSSYTHRSVLPIQPSLTRLRVPSTPPRSSAPSIDSPPYASTYRGEEAIASHMTPRVESRVSPSSSISRTTRFDPVRAAINEGQVSPPCATRTPPRDRPAA